MKRVLILFAALLASACTTTEPAVPALSIVSSRPDVITGGDALVADVPPGATLSVEGAAVGSRALGDYTYVFGLPQGAHELRAIRDGVVVATVAFKNWPAQGPVISGPHEAPFFCQTREFEIGPGAGHLPASQPPLCTVEARRD
ncbi:MAG: hypothetical protein KDI19_10270 [Pseudomonadales bacterium]|nr:hypothetical protein [Pseudomonadales bacterium]